MGFVTQNYAITVASTNFVITAVDGTVVQFQAEGYVAQVVPQSDVLIEFGQPGTLNTLDWTKETSLGATSRTDLIDQIEAIAPSTGGVTDPLSVDEINESTTNAGTTVEGILLRDDQLHVDTIIEDTADSGVTIEGVLHEDNDVTTTGTIQGGDVTATSAVQGATVTGTTSVSGGAISGTTGNFSGTLSVDTIAERTASNNVQFEDTIQIGTGVNNTEISAAGFTSTVSAFFIVDVTGGDIIFTTQTSGEGISFSSAGAIGFTSDNGGAIGLTSDGALNLNSTTTTTLDSTGAFEVDGATTVVIDGNTSLTISSTSSAQIVLTNSGNTVAITGDTVDIVGELTWDFGYSAGWRLNTALDIDDNTTTEVTWTSPADEDFDTSPSSNMLDATNNAIQIRRAGYYQVNCFAGWGTLVGVNSYARCLLYVDDVETQRSASSANGEIYGDGFSVTLNLAVDELLTMSVYYNGSETEEGMTASTVLQAIYLGD